MYIHYIKLQEAYVLKNYVSRHTFVYLGKRADGLLIQRALAYAEVAFTGMRRLSAWKKVDNCHSFSICT